MLDTGEIIGEWETVSRGRAPRTPCGLAAGGALDDEARAAGPQLVEGHDDALVVPFEDEEFVVDSANHVIPRADHHGEYVLERFAERMLAVGW
jgi:hypothetical protein